MMVRLARDGGSRWSELGGRTRVRPVCPRVLSRECVNRIGDKLTSLKSWCSLRHNERDVDLLRRPF